MEAYYKDILPQYGSLDISAQGDHVFRMNALELFLYNSHRFLQEPIGFLHDVVDIMYVGLGRRSPDSLDLRVMQTGSEATLSPHIFQLGYPASLPVYSEASLIPDIMYMKWPTFRKKLRKEGGEVDWTGTTNHAVVVYPDGETETISRKTRGPSDSLAKRIFRKCKRKKQD